MTVDRHEEAAGDAPDGDGLQTSEERGKVRTLEQQMSLKPGDDERTEISKKISWILRHGGRKVNVELDADGWVPLKNLLASEILSGIPKQRLLDVIEESNRHKTRYEFSGSGDQRHIRAVSKSRRKQERNDRKERLMQEVSDEDDDDRDDHSRRRSRRERRERHDAVEAEAGSEDRRARNGAEGAAEAAGKKADNGTDGSHEQENQEGPSAKAVEAMTFEAQLAAGWRPVKQGGQILAMVKGNETVRPGRRTEEGEPRLDTSRSDIRSQLAAAAAGARGEVGKAKPIGDALLGKSSDALRDANREAFARSPEKELEVQSQGIPKGAVAKGNVKGQPKGQPIEAAGRGGKGDWNGAGGDATAASKGSTGKFKDQGKGERADPGGKADAAEGKGGRPASLVIDATNAVERPLWRVVPNQSAIVRSACAMESDEVGTLQAGSLIAQLGAEKVLKNGIVRMLMQVVEPQTGLRGWVTRSAQSVGGPVFFVPGFLSSPVGGSDAVRHQ